MRSLIPIDPGVITPLSNGYVVTFAPMPPSEFHIRTKIEASTMLQIFEVTVDEKPAGFFLYSAFKVSNKGGVLVTYLEAKKGKATSATVVFRHPDIVVYDIAGCGSIAVPTLVSSNISSILSEQ